MTDCVVVIRLDNGDDLLAILDGEVNGIIKVEHPYFIKVNPTTSNVIMMPFCPLSDEIHFEFKKSAIQFLVTANSDISSKFLDMVDAAEQLTLAEMLEEDDPLDELQAAIMSKNFVRGPDTKQ